VTVDFRSLTFIEPVGVTFLSNFFHWLVNRGSKVYVAGCNVNSEALRFLDDSQFFLQHMGRKLSETAVARDTTHPLIKIAHERSHPWLRHELVPWLAAALGTTRASLGPFQACVSELFNNIKDHSTTELGSVFVQHFPQRSEVNLAIADFGRGIPDVVRDVIPGLSDVEAICKAVEENFTSRSTPGNKGAGLY
jgi:hypothetical protein